MARSAFTSGVALGDASLANPATANMSPEQLQAYQAQVQAAVQAQMALWAQMQQNPAMMQQLAAQFQAMSLGYQPAAAPLSEAIEAPKTEKPEKSEKSDKAEEKK